MNVAYDEARQKEALEKYEIKKWFIEKVSGKDTNREVFQNMMEFVREGDTIYIHDFSRLARSTMDLLSITEQLQEKGVHLVSNKENIDTSTATGKLMLTMIAAIAEFERANMLERQREGIAIAKREGKYKGGHVKRIKEDVFQREYQAYMSRSISKGELARRLDISRPTLNKFLRDRQAAQEEESNAEN